MNTAQDAIRILVAIHQRIAQDRFSWVQHRCFMPHEWKARGVFCGCLLGQLAYEAKPELVDLGHSFTTPVAENVVRNQAAALKARDALCQELHWSHYPAGVTRPSLTAFNDHDGRHRAQVLELIGKALDRLRQEAPDVA